MKKHSGRKNGDIDIAGGIARKEVGGVIGNYEDDEPLRFCPHCLEFNLHHVLGPRLNYKARDKDEWLECNKPSRGCGRIYPRYQTKVESTVKDFTETETNPHDQGRTIIGLENKGRRSRLEQDRQRQLAEADALPDEGMRNEARHGLTVEDYTDYSLPENQNIKPDNTRRGGSKLDSRLRDVEDFEISDD